MWHEFDEQEQYLDALVAGVAARLDRATALGNPAGFAVSGGRSPIPMFERLSRADLDWGKVHISLVDERFVAPSLAALLAVVNAALLAAVIVLALGCSAACAGGRSLSDGTS